MSDEKKPRSGRDRRKRDIGPPSGWKERRRSAERRMPEVEELSVAEFMRLMKESNAPGSAAINASLSGQQGTEQDSFDWESVRKL